MTIAYDGQQYLGLDEYIKGADLRRPRGAESYAHPIDAWIQNTLNSVAVKPLLNRAADAYVSWEFGHQLAEAVPVDHRNFPEIYEMVVDCSRSLGIPTPHTTTGQSAGLINAMATGTDEYAIVYIASGLLSVYPYDEARFVIGHECGHIHAGHVVYQMAAQALATQSFRILGPFTSLLGLPLQAWSRRAEITADRAGFICCGDLDVAQRALIRMVTGLLDASRVDVDAYLEQSRETAEFHPLHHVHEIWASHPGVPLRIRALKLFAESEPYYAFTRRSRPAGVRLLRREELDREVTALFRA